MKKYIIFVLIMLIILLGGCVVRPKPVAEHTDTRIAMDTLCTIRAGGELARESVEAAFDRIYEISERVDYFSDTSEVAMINNAVSNVPIKVSDDVFNIIKIALEVSEKSDGAFDITLAPIKDLWNIQGGAHIPPSYTEITEALESVGYKRIILNENERTVTKTADNVKIDLGGAAKGYAADCAIEVLRQSKTAYALVDLGGNVCAIGKNPSREDGKWLIGIQTPFEKGGEYSQTVLIDEGSVVTAGTYQRYFEWQGKMYHHIMDSKTGCPSDSGISNASIVADSSLVADCLSTACVVLGEERGRELAESFGCKLIIEAKAD